MYTHELVLFTPTRLTTIVKLLASIPHRTTMRELHLSLVPLFMVIGLAGGLLLHALHDGCTGILYVAYTDTRYLENLRTY